MVSVLSLCALSACVGQNEGAEEAAQARTDRGADCILKGSIRDYRVLDESNLIVSMSPSRKYHMELTRPAIGLKSSWHIGVSGSGSRVCGDGFSELLVDDSFGPERVRIRKVRRLSTEGYEDLMIRYGKMEPEIEQTRQPEEVEGAEVEELD